MVGCDFMSRTFGEFIRFKRQEQHISLRAFARQIGISPVYTSNIENGKQTAPSYEVILRIAEVLNLNEEEKENMHDLAAETKKYPAIAYDLVEYINANDHVRKALRLSRKLRVEDSDWKEFTNHIKEKYL